MSVYAIGDVQGCHDDLLRLLDRIAFDPGHDKLWFVGDLVNRGPKSLEVLRFVKSLGSAALTVLGNHDLHLVAAAVADRRFGKKKDTLDPVLAAPDRDELIDWLRRRPLFHREGGYCLLHAGLPPQWDVDQADAQARAAEQFLAGDEHIEFFRQMYGNTPAQWSDHLQGIDKLRFAVNCFTRMRYCTPDGILDFAHNGAPGSQPPGLLPWFQVPGRKSAVATIVFGHWSTLGYRGSDNCYAIDTGCLWGGQLTALRLDTVPQRISIDCAGEAVPGKR